MSSKISRDFYGTFVDDYLENFSLLLFIQNNFDRINVAPLKSIIICLAQKRTYFYRTL